MGVVVNFSYSVWAQTFPQFGSVTPAQIENLVLPLAQQYCRNDGGGPVDNAELQASLLNLMVAHVTQLMFGPNGNNPSPLVGRISSAGEGSVNVTTEFPTTANNAWYLQTQWGAMFWQMMAPFRTMRYIPPKKRFTRGLWL